MFGPLAFFFSSFLSIYLYEYCIVQITYIFYAPFLFYFILFFFSLLSLSTFLLRFLTLFYFFFKMRNTLFTSCLAPLPSFFFFPFYVLVLVRVLYCTEQSTIQYISYFTLQSGKPPSQPNPIQPPKNNITIK